MATGAIALNIQQDPANTALHITQGSDALCINLDHNVTNGNATNVAVLYVQHASTVNDGNTYTKSMSAFRIDNKIVETSGTITDTSISLSVNQTHADCTGNTVFINSDGTGAISLSIDSEATTADVIDIATPTTTTGIIFDVNADSLTTGYILDLTSNSSDTSTRRLVNILNDNTLATGTTPMVIQQDAAQTALLIRQFADHQGFYVVKTVTNGNMTASGTSGSLIDNTLVVDDGLTYTKSTAAFRVNSQVTETLGTVTDNSDTLSVNQTHADCTGNTVFINSDATAGLALSIDAENTSSNAVLIDTAATTGRGLDIQASSLTSGAIARFYSNSSSATGRDLVLIHNDHLSADTAVALKIQQDGDNYSLSIDQNGNGTSIFIAADSTTASVIDLGIPGTTTGSIFVVDADSITSGTILNLRSASGDVTARNLVNIVNDNTLATGATCLNLQQDAANQVVILDQNATAAGSSFVDFQGTAAADAVGPVSTLTTAGTVQAWLQIEVNGTKRWIPAYSDPS